jgi:hypothetical protein
MSFSQNTKHIALVGDFNSRTSNLTDYIEKHDNNAKYRIAIIHYILVHWRLMTKRFL